MSRRSKAFPLSTPHVFRAPLIATLIISLGLAAQQAQAIGGDSDGWVTAEPGHPILGWYQIRNSSTRTYASGKATQADTRFTSNVSMLRFIYPVQLPGKVVWTPNVILQYSDYQGNGDLGSLGNTKGLGDLMLVSGFWLKDGRRNLAIVPYLWLPTGKYDKNSSLNAGENRYKGALQIGFQLPLGKSPLDLTGSIDTTVYGKNDATNTQQSPLTEIDGWLKYNFTSESFSHAAIGLVYTVGGENKINGVSQDDETRTTTLKVQFGVLPDSSKHNHILFTLGRDLKVRSGLKVDNHIETRLMHTF